MADEQATRDQKPDGGWVDLPDPESGLRPAAWSPTGGDAPDGPGMPAGDDEPSGMREGVAPRPPTGMDSWDIGPYRIQAAIGSGGMATVYRGVHRESGRKVALKIFQPDVERWCHDFRRFFREAAVGVEVVHPNVVRCFGIGEVGNRFYIAMEYLRGGDLRKLVQDRGGRMGEAEAVRLMVDCAKGLQALHTRGLIHRDLKPSNVFVDDWGVAKLADFGVASMVVDARDNQSGPVVGTPSYMSPEQARGERHLDQRTDIYSLGATLYYLVTGQAPFSGDEPLAVINQVLNQATPDPRAVVPGLSSGLCALLTKAMSKERDQRHPTSAHLLEDLLALAGLHERGAGTKALSKAFAKTMTRVTAVALTKVTTVLASRRTVLPALGLAVAIAAIVSVVWLRSADGAPAPSGQTPAASADGRLPASGLELPLDGAGDLPLRPVAGGWRCDEAASLAAAWRRSGDLALALAAEFPAAPPAQGMILALAESPAARCLALVQVGGRLEWRLRTSRTGAGGLGPHLAVSAPSAAGWHHVALSRQGPTHRIWIDGRPVGSTQVPGSLSPWGQRAVLALGAEVDGSSSWPGAVSPVVVFDRALGDLEVEALWRRWQDQHPATR